MADMDWFPLPTLWPSPAVWTDTEKFELRVFTEDGVPTWEIYGGQKNGRGGGRLDLVARGTADTFEAAKAAAVNVAAQQFR